MNIVFVESLGMCECTINKSLATLKNQGHTVTFYHDRNENEEVLIERARNAEVVVVSNIPLRRKSVSMLLRLDAQTRRQIGSPISFAI